MRKLAIAVVVPLVFMAACGDETTEDTERDESGDIVEAGDVGVFRLQVGDCVILPEGGSGDGTPTVAGFEAVPCDEPHTGEVVSVTEDFFADAGDDFPEDDVLYGQQSQIHCVEALDAYTGTDYETSAFDIFLLAPGEESWNQGDRELVCFGTTVDEAGRVETTGSIKAG